MIAFLVSAIRLGMVFLFGSTGEIITEKSGHLNLGTPGVMCVGASCGCFAEYLYLKQVGPYASPFLAVLIAIVATFIGGFLMGLLFSFLTVTLRANQNVTGLALTTLGVGISDFMIAKTGTSFGRASKYFTASLPFAEDLGWFGKLFLSHGILIYLAIAIALISSFILSKTRIGLNLRSVGENPATADAAGINVSLYRYLATCIGCGISGLGGLTFIMDYLNGNWEYCIDAFGWLSIALVIFTPFLCQLAFNQAYNNADETGIVEQFDVLAHWLKFLYIGLVNLVYYTILYQIWSSVFCNMPGTKANNITLWSIIRGK